MKKLLFLTLISFMIIGLVSCDESTKPAEKVEPAVSTFFFIRHAEKDRSNPDDKDPELTAEGWERADKWCSVFNSISFDAVYSTDYNRTKQTAQPTATKNKVPITIYDPNTLDSAEFLETNKGKTVLVVGHSNTTPALVNALIKEEKFMDIEDTNNANLYVVVFANGSINSSLLQFN